MRRKKRKIKECPRKISEYYNNSIFSLSLAPSRIEGAGLGVYTGEEIAKGEFVGYYEGVLLTDWPGGSPYFMEICEGIGIDAQPYPRCYMAMINDAYGSPYENNCYFEVDQNELTASIYTLRTLQRGEELLMSYGESYWREF